MDKTEIIYAFGWYFLFVISATFHEAAHAWAAKKGGDLTAYEGGQVTLNPWPHIKRAPIGMVVVPIIAIFLIGWPFGWAKTPVDAYWAYEHPRKHALVSLAGPAANLILALISLAIIEIGLHTGFFLGPQTIVMERIVDPASSGFLEGFSIFISMMLIINVILFVFNLLPLPPMDGSSVISLFLKDEAARKYDQVISHPAFALVGILLAWQVFGRIFTYIYNGLIDLIYLGMPYHYSFLTGQLFT